MYKLDAARKAITSQINLIFVGCTYSMVDLKSSMRSAVVSSNPQLHYSYCACQAADDSLTPCIALAQQQNSCHL